MSSTNTAENQKNEMPFFFYGHTVTAENPYGVLSQWWICEIPVDSKSLEYLRRDSNAPAMDSIPASINFNCAEQYMMYCKAIFFNDVSNASAVLKTSDQGKQKALGREVGNFTEQDWATIREQVVEEGNWAKFSHDEHLKGILLSTGDREICEASKFDRVWGIGFNEQDARKMVKDQKHRWGSNLLGKALMRVRSRIREIERE